MSERRVRRKELRPLEILDCARAVFLARGYAKTTFDHIAREGDMARGTIYLYYKSKLEIFRACLDRVVNEHKKILLELEISSSLPFPERISRLLSGFRRFFQEPECAGFIAIILSEGHENPELLTSLSEVVLPRVTAQWQELVEDCGFSSDYSKTVFLCLLWPFVLLSLSVRVSERTDAFLNLEKLEKNLQEMVLRLLG